MLNYMKFFDFIITIFENHMFKVVYSSKFKQMSQPTCRLNIGFKKKQLMAC